MANQSKHVNPMKVITGKDTRWSYANVWEPKSINGSTPKFSVSLIIPKTDVATVKTTPAPTSSTPTPRPLPASLTQTASPS